MPGERTLIRVSVRTKRRLEWLKRELGCPSLDSVIRRLLDMYERDPLAPLFAFELIEK